MHRFHFASLRLIGLLAAMVTCPLPADAARPMITDDARIVDAKSCQLEAWSRRNADSREIWALPGCNPTGQVEWTGGGAHLSDGPVTGVAVLQAKTLFRSLEASPVAWGLAVGLTRSSPKGSVEPYAYAPVTLTAVPEHLFVHLNVGLRHDAAADTVQRTWGLGLESLITRRFGVIAEAFSQERGRSYYQGGLRLWIVPDRVQIDTTMGNRVGQSPGQGSERWMSIGLRLLSPPFLP